jgi:hypothetical protein
LSWRELDLGISDLPIPIYGTIWVLLLAYITKFIRMALRRVGVDDSDQ